MPKTSRERALPRVLVVDDEPLLGKAIARILRSSHEVVYASTAGEALERLGSGEPFDVVLCDLMMPEMTGMDLYRQLLRQRPEAASRIVFITGGAFTQGAVSFLEEVPNRRLEKPFDQQTLVNLIDSNSARQFE